MTTKTRNPKFSLTISADLQVVVVTPAHWKTKFRRGTKVERVVVDDIAASTEALGPGVTKLTVPGVENVILFKFFKTGEDARYLDWKMSQKGTDLTHTINIDMESTTESTQACEVMASILNDWLSADLQQVDVTDHGVERVTKARNAEGGNMMMFTMQDRVAGIVAREDVGLSLAGVLEMTDFREGELDCVARLEVGEEFLLGGKEVEGDRIKVIRVL